MQLKTAVTIQSSKLIDKIKTQITPDTVDSDGYKVNLDVLLTLQDLLVCAIFLPKEEYNELLQNIINDSKIGGTEGATNTSQ